MRKIALAAALAVAGLAGNVAMAGTATGNFYVNITLKSKCQLSSNGTSWGGGDAADLSWVLNPGAGPNPSGTPPFYTGDNTSGLTPLQVAATYPDTPLNNYSLALTNLSMTYTSFQPVASQGVTSFQVRCTNSLPYTVKLSKVATPTTYDGGTQVQDDQLKLNYSLAISDSTSYQATAASTTASLTNPGTDTPRNIYVYGTIPAAQYGLCNAATCENFSNNNNAGSPGADRQRYVTVVY